MRTFSILLGAMIFFAVPQIGSAQSSGGVMKKVTPDAMANMVRDFGYRAEVVQGEKSKYIRTAMAGYNVAIYLYGCAADGCDSAQMLTSFDSAPDLTIGLANRWNTKFRYAHAYIDPADGDFYFEHDFAMTGITKEFVKENLTLYENQLGRLVQFKKEGQ